MIAIDSRPAALHLALIMAAAEQGNDSRGWVSYLDTPEPTTQAPEPTTQVPPSPTPPPLERDHQHHSSETSHTTSHTM